MTRKPMHIFSALVILVVAAIVVSQWWFMQTTEFPSNPGDTDAQTDHVLWMWMRIVAGSAVSTAQVIGVAVLVELVDQIRWSSLDDEGRAASGSGYLLARLAGLRGR